MVLSERDSRTDGEKQNRKAQDDLPLMAHLMPRFHSRNTSTNEKIGKENFIDRIFSLIPQSIGKKKDSWQQFSRSMRSNCRCSDRYGPNALSYSTWSNIVVLYLNLYRSSTLPTLVFRRNSHRNQTYTRLEFLSLSLRFVDVVVCSAHFSDPPAVFFGLTFSFCWPIENAREQIFFWW